MEGERLKILLDKFRSGQCTPQEKEEVMQWYRSLDAHYEYENKRIKEVSERYIDRMYQQFLRDYAEPLPRKNTRVRIPVLKIAAAALLIISVGAITTYVLQSSLFHKQKMQTTAGKDAASPGSKGITLDTRYFKLPDSSTVILHAGSSLKMNNGKFDTKIREVVLNGEAYFDIHQEENSPFVIRVGKLKVTVLGTAFNIKESADSVIVTVARGKVKIEDEQKVLGVLTRAQQIIYNGNQAIGNVSEVPVVPAIHWTVKDMQFDNATLKQVAEILQKRYSVTIAFKNPAIETCKYTITDAFDGMAPLDKVLDIICTTFNCKYTYTGKGIIIDGEGCHVPAIEATK